MKNLGPLRPSEALSEYLISTDLAKAMHRKYKSNQQAILNKRNKFNETQSVWIPFDVLEVYLEYIKYRYRQVGDKTDDNGVISGVRIHFSSFGSESEEEVRKELFGDKKDRLTLTMMPTICYEKIDPSFSDADKKKYKHVRHVPVCLVGPDADNKRIVKYPHKKPRKMNENTTLIGRPFPPPPNNG